MESQEMNLHRSNHKFRHFLLVVSISLGVFTSCKYVRTNNHMGGDGYNSFGQIINLGIREQLSLEPNLKKRRHRHHINRKLAWHEYLDHSSGYHYYSNGINTTWDPPPECLPDGCGDNSKKGQESALDDDDDDFTTNSGLGGELNGNSIYDDDDVNDGVIDDDDLTGEEIAAHSKNQTKTPQLPLWIQTNLANISNSNKYTDASSSSEVTIPFFWHIPKAAGTAIQNLYWCMGLTLANEVGALPKFGHENDTSLLDFQPFSSAPSYHVVNVDTTTRKGILHAKELGLISSYSNRNNDDQPSVDLIVSGELNFAAQYLLDVSHKGRVFAMFRHPVDRALSLFYYLRSADWEPTYQPQWNNMTIMEWAQYPKGEHSWVVRKLVGKERAAEINMEDLELAKEIIRTKVLVGLDTKFLSSVRRFNRYLGIDDNSDIRNNDYYQHQKCMITFAGQTANDYDGDSNEKLERKHNSGQHPKVMEGSKEWDALVDKNRLDVLLYEYVELLYEYQGKMFDNFDSGDSS